MTMSAFLHWLFVRPWSVWLIVLLGALHYFATSWWSDNIALIHAMVALVTQIFGVVLVVLSIDDALGVFEGGGLISMLRKGVLDFWHDRTWKKVNEAYVRVELPPLTSEIAMKASGTVVSQNETLEERVVRMEKDLNKYRNEVRGDISRLSSKLDDVRDNYESEVQRLDGSISKVNRNVTTVVAGGIQKQLFGVTLITYSAIAAFLSFLASA